MRMLVTISLHTDRTTGEVFAVQASESRVGYIQDRWAGPLNEWTIKKIRQDPWHWWEDNLPNYALTPEHPRIERLASRLEEI